VFIANCIFAWIWVFLSIAGYYFVRKRLGEKWNVWAFLAVGWFFLATAQTIFLFSIELNLALIATLWIMSYILIMASIVLLFLKVIRYKRMKLE
jgi:uncharacterized membrane protein